MGSIEQKPLKKTIGEWEDENNRTWPVLDRKLVLKQNEKGRDTESTEEIAKWWCEKRKKKKVPGWVAVSFKLEEDDYGMACKTLTLGMILTYRESHTVASKIHERCFSCPLSIPGAYFNFELDTLYIQYDCVLAYAK